ncbi:MAG: gamma-glutamylcyclotransferase [Sandaracinaceae bacterium]|nr:gamma-glutamylcyclotransferase [Sandaracinaceae bacterium]
MRYFGYGSNLHAEDLARWLRAHGFDPGAIREVGPAWLPDHEPVYHYFSAVRDGGALSVRERVGCATPGALFDVDDAGWRALDRKEGAKYERVRRWILCGGREVEAHTYVVREAHREERHVAPRPEYAELVRAGLEARGLPTEQATDATRRLGVDAFPRRLFVYGTLLRGESRGYLLDRYASGPRTTAHIRGRLVHLGAYPGLVFHEGGDDGEVEGELVELDEPADAFEELDAIEDFRGYGRPDSLYRREPIEVGPSGHAWTYRYLGPDAPRIASGDWRRRPVRR